jgi:hypothetical protein
MYPEGGSISECPLLSLLVREGSSLGLSIFLLKNLRPLC